MATEDSKKRWEKVRALQQEYSWLFPQILETLNKHDPIGIYQSGNGSYYSEMGTILPRLLKEATSPVMIRTILYEELNWWFGGVVDTDLRERPAQTEARFTALAEDLWMVYQRWLAEQAGHD